MFATQLKMPFQAVAESFGETRSSVTTRETIAPSFVRGRASALACVGGLFVALHVVVSGAFGLMTQVAALGAAICFVCQATLVIGGAWAKISDEHFVWVARAALLVHAAALAVYDMTLHGSRVTELSLVAVQALAVGAAIPMRWLPAVTIVGITCLLQPLSAHVATLLKVVPGEAGMLAQSWLGAFLTFVLTFGLRAIVHTFPAAMDRSTGAYVLKRKLGEGGMGEVWDAQHSSLACSAAVKIIRTPQDERSISRFQREARVTAMLTSIHTVKLYDYGLMQDGRPYYAMELLNGFDLQRVVDESGPLPAARVVMLMKQVCDSLAEAHAAGLVHRDLKPPNLFITHLGRQFDVVKVLDFGLVAIRRTERDMAVSTLTKTGRIAGTPEYCAPELLFGASPDARSDIYQLGCVMFFLLTGERVFPAASPMASLLMHATEQPRRASDIKGAAIPRDVDDLVARCLDKEPSKRPRSASDLLSLLERSSCANDWTKEEARRWWTDMAVFPELSQESAARRLRT